MLTQDNSAAAIADEVRACKDSVKLDPDSQQHEDSGHMSAPYGNGPDQSAAKPSGSPGTGNSTKY